MDNIFSQTFSNAIFNENQHIFVQNSLKYVPKGTFDDNPALVQVMHQRQAFIRTIFYLEPRRITGSVGLNELIKLQDPCMLTPYKLLGDTLNIF